MPIYNIDRQPTRFPPPTLPWHRDAASLPAPLPTVAEIKAATHDLPTMFKPAARRTVVVRDVFVVKYGRFVFENEGHALLLLEAEASTVPAPRLHAMFRDDDDDDDDDVLYIVMQHMPGQQLMDVWDGLPDSNKDLLAGQLRQVFVALQQLPAPEYPYAAVCGKLVNDRCFYRAECATDTGILPLAQFDHDFMDSDEQLEEGEWSYRYRHSWMLDIVRQHLWATPGEKIVFSHSDFQRKNVLVLKDAEDGTYKLAAVVDWEWAGWFPESWEYARSFMYLTWDDSWGENAEKIVRPVGGEYAVLCG